MPTKTTQAELERNRTHRRCPPPQLTDDERARYRRNPDAKSGLVSKATRKNRKVRAHFRSTMRVGGKAKHLKSFLDANGKVRMNKRHRTLDGSPLAPHVVPDPQDPYEARATSRRPWTVRNDNRRRNRVARASRKANR